VESGAPEVVLYDTGYTREQLAAIPAEAVGLSLGCGNPAAMASLRPGEVVLDIGSGAGADLFPAAQRVGPTGKVIGVDMLEEMLARARKTAQQRGYTNVEFRQGDASHLPVEDGSVDVVMSNCVINLVEDKGQVFQEACRVLKPGGRLAISDVVTDRPFSPAMLNDPEAWSACVTGALPESEYLSLITQAGFTQLSVKRSQSWPAPDGTLVYSLNVSAEKKQ
jgi:ubiquinone/menaquinone biosynthesis C-methylase UbiE